MQMQLTLKPRRVPFPRVRLLHMDKMDHFKRQTVHLFAHYSQEVMNWQGPLHLAWKTNVVYGVRARAVQAEE